MADTSVVLLNELPTVIDDSRRVWYIYDDDEANFSYGRGHHVQPHRLRVLHSLLANYGLLHKLQVIRPPRAQLEDLTKFHTDDYVHFLQQLKGDIPQSVFEEGPRWNIDDDLDCTFMDGAYEFAQIYAGGSIAAARALTTHSTDIALHWGGGFSHSSRDQAAGSSYVNDVVLGILELLTHFDRVLYIDMDVHHCDAVEEAFYTTDRVMTVSLHKYSGTSYPGTGDFSDVGFGRGKYYSINFPMNVGIDDEHYVDFFKRIVERAKNSFKPDAIVLLASPSILAGERISSFNITLRGHARCVKMVRDLNLPLLVLGGGPSASTNSVRLWTYLTAKLLKTRISDDIPYNEFYEYFGPRFKLSIEPRLMDNLNVAAALDMYNMKFIDNMDNVHPASKKEPGKRPTLPTEQQRKQDLFGLTSVNVVAGFIAPARLRPAIGELTGRKNSLSNSASNFANRTNGDRDAMPHSIVDMTRFPRHDTVISDVSPGQPLAQPPSSHVPAALINGQTPSNSGAKDEDIVLMQDHAPLATTAPTLPPMPQPPAAAIVASDESSEAAVAAAAITAAAAVSDRELAQASAQAADAALRQELYEVERQQALERDEADSAIASLQLLQNTQPLEGDVRTADEDEDTEDYGEGEPDGDEEDEEEQEGEAEEDDYESAAESTASFDQDDIKVATADQPGKRRRPEEDERIEYKTDDDEEAGNDSDDDGGEHHRALTERSHDGPILQRRQSTSAQRPSLMSWMHESQPERKRRRRLQGRSDEEEEEEEEDEEDEEEEEEEEEEEGDDGDDDRAAVASTGLAVPQMRRPGLLPYNTSTATTDANDNDNDTEDEDGPYDGDE